MILGFGISRIASYTIFLNMRPCESFIQESCTFELRQNQPRHKYQFHRIPNWYPATQKYQRFKTHENFVSYTVSFQPRRRREKQGTQKPIWVNFVTEKKKRGKPQIALTTLIQVEEPSPWEWETSRWSNKPTTVHRPI